MDARDKAYKMYKQLDAMHFNVFDIYHDMMYDSMQQIDYMLDDEDDYSSEIALEIEKMKNMIKSAEYMNKVFK